MKKKLVAELQYFGSRTLNRYECLKCGFKGSKMEVQNHCKRCYTKKELNNLVVQ
jgi:hypothetical protein